MPHRDYGSSPLVRGQRVHRYQLRRELRIIPARAGPTLRVIDVCGSTPDHPRSCGANGAHPTGQRLEPGSSPLVRGQPGRRPITLDRTRIIPARAGPTAARTCTTCRPTDHPRSCGANFAEAMREYRRLGSSPLVRGQRGHPCAHWWRWADHPRSCGANRKAVISGLR